MKKVLMISYYYPPLVDVGSLRALGFSKYLPFYGWQPYVLSVKNPDRSICTVGNMKEHTNISAFYVRSLFNLNWITWKANGLLRIGFKLFGKELRRNIVQDLFCFPDIFIGWIQLSFLFALRLMRKYKINIIYVSCKPDSSAITGVLLKKVTKKPLVLDFRDPISFAYDSKSIIPTSKIRQRFLSRFEKYLVKEANEIIVTSDQIKKRYLSLYPSLKGKIHLVYNGFFNEYLPKDEINKFEKFTIIYTGSFYTWVPPVSLFFKALHKVIQQRFIPKDSIRFLYLGHKRKKTDWLGLMARDYNLNDTIVAYGHLSIQETMQTMAQSSLFLIRLMPPMINTKLYEALAVGVPILALGGKGDAQELIERYSNHSYVVTSNKVDDVVDAIKSAYHKWEKGQLKKSKNEDFLQTFNKKALTKQFVQTLEEVYQANRCE